jgi:YjbE family integral membrane protein
MNLMALVGEPLFWKSLVEIIIVNIILSGDNAVVIALAARHLPHKQQKAAIFWGSAAAIVLRVVLTLFAVNLLQFPYLKLVGAGLLIWIGAKLLLPEEEDRQEGVTGDGKGLFGAIRTILIADLVMSLDNVIAVAAAAETGPVHGRVALLIIGLGLSIPLAGHHHARGGAARLRRRRDGGHRSGDRGVVPLALRPPRLRRVGVLRRPRSGDRAHVGEEAGAKGTQEGTRAWMTR